MASPRHNPGDRRRPLHAHARDTPPDSYGRYGVDDSGENAPSPFHGIEGPGQVSAPALPLPSGFRVGLGTSSRHRRRSASPHPRPQRATDLSHAPYHRPSPPSPSPHGERYHERHQRARGESSRSPRFDPSSSRAKKPRLEAGHEDSSSGMYVRR
jgi:hypothetical protein